MKDKFVQAYMDVAERFAELSTAQRLQVGAIAVKDDRIISIGYNGTPKGWDNICEEDGVTKPEVLHAESNVIAKLAKSSESADGATLFVTHSPCMHCAKQIYQAGFVEVYYKHEYRNTDGLEFLKKCEIFLKKVEKNA